MTFSRRHLLASLGLALPAVSVLAAEANAATSHKKHKPTKHVPRCPTTTKHHKPLPLPPPRAEAAPGHTTGLAPPSTLMAVPVT